MKALLIIDLQYDFLPGGALEIPEGDQIIPLVNNLQRSYDLVVATQDWHPPDHLSFASQHAGKRPYQTMMQDGYEQTLWPDHCIQGSYGAQLSADLQTDAIEAFFRKGTNRSIDSYSGFFDNRQEKAIGMGGYLRERGINEVHVCGLAADFCVYFTAMDSLGAAFKTAILTNATRALDNSRFIEKRENFISQGGILL